MNPQNLSLPQALTKLNWANKRCKFAWAKYYESINENHIQDHQHYTRLETTTLEEAIPAHIKNSLMEMAQELRKKWECPVCFDFIPDGSLQITNCGHFFCNGCLNGVKQNSKRMNQEKWSCPVCRRNHSHSDES
jgi:rubrerythrin